MDCTVKIWDIEHEPLDEQEDTFLIEDQKNPTQFVIKHQNEFILSIVDCTGCVSTCDIRK